MAAHDSRSVRLRPSGQPGRGAADPQGPRGRGEGPVGRATASCRWSSCGWPSRGCSSTSRRSRGLDGIAEDDDWLRIGGRATHRQIATHEVDRRAVPDDRASSPAASATRRSATGGRSAAPSPTRIPPRTGRRRCSPRNATIVCRGLDGEREILARDFFLDTFTTAIEPTEILTEVRIRRRSPGQRRRYQKLERRVGDFATAGVATVVVLARRTARSGTPASASPASRRRRSRRPAPSSCSSGRSRATTCSGPPVRPRARRASPSPTSGVPRTTSARWSPS